MGSLGIDVTKYIHGYCLPNIVFFGFFLTDKIHLGLIKKTFASSQIEYPILGNFQELDTNSGHCCNIIGKGTLKKEFFPIK